MFRIRVSDIRGSLVFFFSLVRFERLRFRSHVHPSIHPSTIHPPSIHHGPKSGVTSCKAGWRVAGLFLAGPFVVSRCFLLSSFFFFLSFFHARTIHLFRLRSRRRTRRARSPTDPTSLSDRSSLWPLVFPTDIHVALAFASFPLVSASAVPLFSLLSFFLGRKG